MLIFNFDTTFVERNIVLLHTIYYIFHWSFRLYRIAEVSGVARELNGLSVDAVYLILLLSPPVPSLSCHSLLLGFLPCSLLYSRSVSLKYLYNVIFRHQTENGWFLMDPLMQFGLKTWILCLMITKRLVEKLISTYEDNAKF